MPNGCEQRRERRELIVGGDAHIAPWENLLFYAVDRKFVTVCKELMWLNCPMDAVFHILSCCNAVKLPLPAGVPQCFVSRHGGT